jgi:hypothetical protein
MRNRTTALIVLASVLFLSGCQHYVSGPEHKLDGPLIIRSGTSFGECLGYCWTELALDEKAIELRAKQWYPDEKEREHRGALARARWEHLVSMIDLETFLTLDDRYGCPDCADGGAEWIELETEDVRKRVVFEYGDTLEPISDLLRELRTLREEAIEEAGWR